MNPPGMASGSPLVRSSPGRPAWKSCTLSTTKIGPDARVGVGRVEHELHLRPGQGEAHRGLALAPRLLPAEPVAVEGQRLAQVTCRQIEELELHRASLLVTRLRPSVTALCKCARVDSGLDVTEGEARPSRSRGLRQPPVPGRDGGRAGRRGGRDHRLALPPLRQQAGPLQRRPRRGGAAPPRPHAGGGFRPRRRRGSRRRARRAGRRLRLRDRTGVRATARRCSSGPRRRPGRGPARRGEPRRPESPSGGSSRPRGGRRSWPSPGARHHHARVRPSSCSPSTRTRCPAGPAPRCRGVRGDGSTSIR